MKGRRSKVNIVKIVLTVLAVSTFVSIAVLAPNALQFLRMFPWFRRNRRNEYFYRYYVKSVVGRLVDKGLVELKTTPSGKKFLKLTRAGREELLRYQLGELKIKGPKHWDGKWRVLIFDIREVRRGQRDRLRKELVNLGFVRLQDSVWVHPHECREVVILLKSYFHFGRELLYLEVNRIENDKWLRQLFNLPPA